MQSGRRGHCAEALDSLVRQIAEYAGTVVLSRVRQHGETISYDAARGEYVDTFMAGIIDRHRSDV